MNYNCSIIDDLLPLYLDGACSIESKAAIDVHLKSCAACRGKLKKMKVEDVIPPIHRDCEIDMKKYAGRVKRHRIKLALATVAVSVVVACVLSLVFLTLKDMHNYANPVIHPVEAGVYNLTLNDLTVPVSEVDEYTFFTNNKVIEVIVDSNSDYSGEVLLWNVDDRNDPQIILYGNITPDAKSCRYTGLSSAHRYMVTCDGNEDMMLTVTDGRNVTFFGSMKNVLNEILDMIIWKLSA